MKNPNGFGTIRYYKKGRRRKPYGFFITVEVLQPDGTVKKVQKAIEWFATLKEAKVFQVEYWKSPFNPVLKDITFKEVYERYILPDIEKMGKSSKANKKVAYGKCKPLYDMKVRDIKYSHIKALLESYSHQAESTIKALKGLLSDVFKFCVREDLISKNPVEEQVIVSEKESEKKDSYTREEVHMLWDNLDFVVVPNPTKKTAYVKRTPMIDTVLILIYTGLRIDEFVSLKTEDIHLKERYITIRGTKTDCSERIVPIHSLIIPLIEKRMNGTYFLENDKGQRITYDTYRDTFFNPMREKLGLNKGIHETRHTFSTFTALCDFNLVMRQKMLGHVSNNITNDVYTHVFIEDLVREIDKLVI